MSPSVTPLVLTICYLNLYIVILYQYPGSTIAISSGNVLILDLFVAFQHLRKEFSINHLSLGIDKASTEHVGAIIMLVSDLESTLVLVSILKIIWPGPLCSSSLPTWMQANLFYGLSSVWKSWKTEIKSDNSGIIGTKPTENMPTYIYAININSHYPKGLKRNMSCLYIYTHCYFSISWLKIII